MCVCGMKDSGEAVAAKYIYKKTPFLILCTLPPLEHLPPFLPPSSSLHPVAMTTAESQGARGEGGRTWCVSGCVSVMAAG